MEKFDKKLKEIEQNMKMIEDEVFADFCSRIGVRNIRCYEGVNLRFIRF